MKLFRKKVNAKEVENTYIPKKRLAIQSTVDCGEGLSFNEKALHIFTEIKRIKLNQL